MGSLDHRELSHLVQIVVTHKRTRALWRGDATRLGARTCESKG